MRHLLAILSLICGQLIAAAPPNIIVFYTDDHGYADLGIHDIVKDVKTPHTDALARSGVLARHGYSTAPQCVPSRAGLLTGRFQARFGVESNQSPLDGFDRQTTIAKRLQDAGYATAQFGKWHLGPDAEITRHGFTHVFAQNAQRPFHANITLDGQDRPMSPLPPAGYHIDSCSQAAAAVIERYKDKPFFLYIAYRAPHTPLDAPQHYKDRFPGDMPERRRAALAMISAIDDGVGLITSTLKKHHLTEKTLIFYIADNGAPLKIHQIDSPLDGDPGGWDGSLNTPLNGEKGMLTEGGIHVPFLIAWPGTIPAGQVYEHPVSTLDVAATSVKVAGALAPENAAKPAAPLDGTNLIPHLTGQNQAPPHPFLAWRWIAQSAIREGQWKLLRGGDREYLYDLAADLEEKHNLASQHPDIAARLRAKLTTWTAELSPPGLTTGPMARTWTDYFDHYLEDKPMPLPAKAARRTKDAAHDPLKGWIARNGIAAIADGCLILKADPAAKRARPFLTHSDISLPGPVTAVITLRATQPGDLTFAWRTKDDKDFLPASKATLTLPASDQPQTLELPLPVTSRLIHLRLHPSQPDSVHIHRLQLKARNGQQQTWSFQP